MEFTFYQVDAFAERPFSGNPAAVVVQDSWLEDSLMQAIALEMNLSETAFVVPVDTSNNHYAIRWFTPAKEVELCGHATLASAHVLFRHLTIGGECVTFDSASGPLTTTLRNDALLELNFPLHSHTPVAVSPQLTQALGAQPQAVLDGGTRLMVVFAHADEVAQLQPDMHLLMQLPQYGICCTAPGDGAYAEFDFVCRFFAPQAGIPEDPVTGSAYTALVPYYAEKTGRTHFSARQISRRGGNLTLSLQGDRVTIAGHAVTVARGTFNA